MGSALNVATLQAPGSLVGRQARFEWLQTTINGLDTREIDLLVLPELYLTGYNIGQDVQQWAEEHDGRFSRQIAKLAKSNQMAIHFGYAEQDGNQIYNSAACYDKSGHMTGHHRKLLLPPGFESDYFSQGHCYSHYQIGDFRVATLICYDAEFPEAFRQVSVAGCDLVIVPTALGEQWGVVSNKVIPTRAFENGVYVCYVNHCGQENGMSYFGGSCIVGPDGQDIARATGNEETLIAKLNLDAVATARQRLPYHIDRLQLPGITSSNRADKFI